MNNTIQYNWNKNRILIVCLVLLVPIPFLFTNIIYLNYMDMYRYIKIALMFDKGDANFFVNFDRTVLFPYILNRLFHIFGYSLSTLKVFYGALLSVLCFQAWYMVRSYLGNDSGAISAAFIGSSFIFGHFVFFPHVDLLLLVCMNGSLLILFQVLKNHKRQFWWIFFSGLSVGIAYAIKQTALLLIFIVPTYLIVVERAPLGKTIRLWAYHLLGFGVILVPIVIMSYPNSFGYVQNFISAINKPTGAGKRSLDISFTRIFTYYFNPVLWQWNHRLPYNVTIVQFDQFIGLSAFVLLMVCRQVDKGVKAFVAVTLFLFAPWYAYVALKGFKARQLLFPEYLIFLSLGPVLHYLSVNWLKPLLTKKTWIRFVVCGCLLLCVLYSVRIYSVNHSIQEGLTAASTSGLKRPDPFRTMQ